ncbi:lasso peptide isopeptide bond-forming cyclase [Streptomyces mobaraensis]|uniref:Lasso peptide isopeptide bond-forming cyclase n=1 Tax=Streptomyces mobaraensis TaxID=35621 RepID=A0A5N5W5D8_STRMB|nr:lasso peptide isopeptide bond-forming cyclase [Streptomyces mobaraensis]KAB7842809.1 lasso peptide isopeptide bond-forming cyclase [Streptomyces mobaraensis]
MPTPREAGGAGPGAASFVVLPDCDDALTAARSLIRQDTRDSQDIQDIQAPHYTRTIPHPSGRPWIAGRWHDEDVTAVRAGRAALAVIGCCPVRPEELRRRAEALRDLTALDALARALPGSFHLVAALDGAVRVQGTASGLRLVHRATVGGVEVAASDALPLARALDSVPDEEELAVRLLWPVPHPLFATSPWRGVTAVPAEDALYVSRDGRTVRHSRWWTPPEPVRSMAGGAPLVRQALTEAVAARTHRGSTVSCDLSGGLDSTSVCFLAAASPARVIASTWPGRDPADSDLAWARRAARHLPHVEHVVWDADESPLVYTDLLDIDEPMDEPTIGVMDRARALHHLPELARRGSSTHLTGIGGDHVAWCSEGYYHRLLRTRPWFALRQLRGFRTLYQWPLAPAVRTLADSRPYGRWLAGTAARLRDPLPPGVEGALGWGTAPRLFPWVTPEAAEAARRALLRAAATAEPLHRDRGLHQDLEQIRICTRIVRQWDLMAARAGLPTASPFFDDRVIEACLAVDPRARVTPWAYKPLLGAAMRGIVPDACLARTDKAHASMDASNGLREHRGDLVKLWEDSSLARLGLVDAGELTALAQRPATPGLGDAILYSTIGCEVWLRTLAR